MAGKGFCGLGAAALAMATGACTGGSAPSNAGFLTTYEGLAPRTDVAQLGISGEEPTLLGDGLGRLIDACGRRLPDTNLHILSNGRTFADPVVAAALGDRGHPSVTWGIPLYADHAELHDAVVDAHGAFEETIQGLYEMGRLGARIELRVVLHALTVDRLPQLASYTSTGVSRSWSTSP